MVWREEEGGGVKEGREREEGEKKKKTLHEKGRRKMEAQRLKHAE